MKDIFAGLLDNMDIQLQVYRRLLALAREKQPVLVQGDIPDLEKITKDEELLIMEVGRQEKARWKIHQALASHLALSPEELTFSVLLEHLEGDAGVRLQQVYDELTGVLRELAELNETNTELIKNSLDFVNFSIDVLTNESRVPVYGDKDEEKQQAAARIFDRKI